MVMPLSSLSLSLLVLSSFPFWGHTHAAGVPKVKRWYPIGGDKVKVTVEETKKGTMAEAR